MSDFLKKLKADLEEGKKTEYVETFTKIVEQANGVDVKKVQEKIDDLDFEQLGLLGTVEDVEKGDAAQKAFLEEQEVKDKKELLKAAILQLGKDNDIYRLAIEQNEEQIKKLNEEFFTIYGEHPIAKTEE